MIITEGNCIKVLHFLLHDTRYCLDLHCVEKILPLPLLEAVPGCPDHCAGLMNFKNKCVPVFDLAMSLGLVRDQTYPLNTPILLCSDGTHQIGLIVDKVAGLGEIDKSSIEIHDEFTVNHSPFLGAVTLESGVSLLVNSFWVFGLKLQNNQSPKDHE